MCSIIGYCGRPADLTAFQAGFARTVSRGPDDSRVIDVGQGDSEFIYCDGKTMLIDGGPGSANGKTAAASMFLINLSDIFFPPNFRFLFV